MKELELWQMSYLNQHLAAICLFLSILRGAELQMTRDVREKTRGAQEETDGDTYVFVQNHNTRVVGSMTSQHS